MAKSIRAKCKKRSRTIKRDTIGEAQLQKNLRKTIRRMRKAITTGDPERTDGPERAAPLVDVLKGGEAPLKLKKLRYTFNTAFREARLQEDLEDLTDDEEDLRLGVLSGAAADAEDDVDGLADDSEVVVIDVMEEAGVRKSSTKPVTKRENTGRDQFDKFYGRNAGTSEFAGLYESDPALLNPRRAEAHRKRSRSKAKNDFWAKKK
jgi:hypothetical protein